MRKFWESSPEWQRQKEAEQAEDEARARRRAAGTELLLKIEVYGPESSTLEEEARIRFLEACEAKHEATKAWVAASSTFRDSAAGQAFARYLADPISATTTESAAA